MKITPENRVKVQLRLLLNELGFFHYPAVAGPYSVGGVPDIIGCYKGKFVGMECKAPGKLPTALQLKFKEKIEASSGKWFLIDGEESMARLRE